MRAVLYFTLIVLSLVVLGAHFLRVGNVPFVGACLLLIGLLAVRRPVGARLAQTALVLGALEWLWTMYRLVEVRAALDQPYTRMAVILSVVAAVTFTSALLFQTPTLKRIYGLDESANGESEDPTDAGE